MVGFIRDYFFKYISSLGALEVTIHRLIWTSFILFLTLIFKKFNILKKILKQKKNLLILFFTKYSYFFKLGDLDLCYFN